MSKFNPVAILYDSNSNPVLVVSDGPDKLLGTAGKTAQRPDGSIGFLMATSSGIVQFAAHDIYGNDISVVTTSGGADHLLQTAARTAVDPQGHLQFFSVTNSGGVNTVLYDIDGHPIDVTKDDSRYILAVDSKVAKKEDDSLHHLDMNESGTIKVSLYSEVGAPIAFPVTSSDPSLLVSDFVRQDEPVQDDSDLLVDGSVTPVSFHFHADTTYDIDLIGFTFVIVANALTFGADNFAGLNALTNGVLVQVDSNGSTGTLYNIVQNECFLHAASIGGFNLLISNRDVIQSTIEFGGNIRLRKNTSDKLTVTIRDDLSSGVNYFKCSVKAIKEI